MLIKFYEKRKKEKLRKLKIQTAKKILMGTAAGSLGGLVGGLLLSPKSGKETREDIGNVSKDISNNIKHKTEELKETIDYKVSAVKDTATDTKMRIKQKTEQIRENIDTKVSDVKDSASEAKIKISEYLNEKKISKAITDCEDLASIAVQANITESEIKENEIKE